MPPLTPTSGKLAPAGKTGRGSLLSIAAGSPRVMNRNSAYLVIAVLAIAAVVLGYQLYQERQKSGVDISIGDRGISIEKK